VDYTSMKSKMQEVL
jgi:hypothetical protein